MKKQQSNRGSSKALLPLILGLTMGLPFKGDRVANRRYNRTCRYCGANDCSVLGIYCSNECKDKQRECDRIGSEPAWKERKR